MKGNWTNKRVIAHLIIA